jgi:hypothetical protein
MGKLLYREGRVYTVIMIVVFVLGITAAISSISSSSFSMPFDALFGLMISLILLFTLRKKFAFLDFYENYFEKVYPLAKKKEKFSYDDVSKVEEFSFSKGRNIFIYIKERNRPFNVYYSNKLKEILEKKSRKYKFKIESK